MDIHCPADSSPVDGPPFFKPYAGVGASRLDAHKIVARVCEEHNTALRKYGAEFNDISVGNSDVINEAKLGV